MSTELRARFFFLKGAVEGRRGEGGAGEGARLGAGEGAQCGAAFVQRAVQRACGHVCRECGEGAKALALMNGTGGTRKLHFNYFCKHSLREVVRTARYPARAHAEHRNGRDCGCVHLPRLRTNRQGWAFFDLPLALFVLPLPLPFFCLPFFLPLAWIRCS